MRAVLSEGFNVTSGEPTYARDRLVAANARLAAAVVFLKLRAAHTEGEGRARPHCRFAPPLIRFIPDL